MGNKIYVAGKAFDIEAKCVAWHEPGGLNAMIEGCSPEARRICPGGGIFPFSPQAKTHSRLRYMERRQIKGQSMNLAAVQSVVRQFILHLDGCPSAKVCFHVLQNERGLSCHFLLDNDGTLYQTLDLAYTAWHAAGFNSNSIGIEIANRGDAKKSPNFYKDRRFPRQVVTCQINEHVYLAYDYTEAQYATMRALGKALTRALPNIPLDYPQDSPGHQSWKSDELQARGFVGYLGHYHTTRRKWDPGPFDFKKFCESIRGRLSLPVSPKRGIKPDVPEDNASLLALTKQLWFKSEEAGEGKGGYFPIGPWGETRIWHGGAHLHFKEAKEPVYAPFAGRIVLALMKPPNASQLHSVNFVLVRYDLAVGPVSLRFWMLFMHLYNDADAESEKPKWLQSEAVAKLPPDKIWKLDEPVEAGELIGHIDRAGPSDQRGYQLHMAVFAREDTKAKIEQLTKKWTIIDGTASGRFADDSRINQPCDTNKDGKLTRQELTNCFRSGSNKDQLRWTAVYCVSEFTNEPDWYEAAKQIPDFEGMPQEKVEQIIDQQVLPTLWWTEENARHAKLPTNGEVYHYHPITFLHWINEELLAAKALPDDGVGAFSKDAAKETPDDVTDDLGDVDGDSFVTEAELKDEGEVEPDYSYDDLVKGFE